MDVIGLLAVMCPACSRGAHGRWPRWTSAGWDLIRSSGSKTLLFFRLTQPVGATDTPIILSLSKRYGADRRPS